MMHEEGDSGSGIGESNESTKIQLLLALTERLGLPKDD